MQEGSEDANGASPLPGTQTGGGLLLVPLGWNGLLMTCSLGLGLVHLRGDCLANRTSAQPLQLPRGTGERGASEVACSAVFWARAPVEVGLRAVEEGGGGLRFSLTVPCGEWSPSTSFRGNVRCGRQGIYTAQEVQSRPHVSIHSP